MAHVRQQIRDAVIVAVTGLGVTGANVFNSRVLPVGATLPALLVYTDSEAVDYIEGAMSCRPMRTINIAVRGYYQGDDPDLGDDIAAEVETAIFSDGTFGSVALFTQLGDTETTRDGAGDKITATVDLSFLVNYRTVDGAPEVSV